jgi:hypothetical protein
MLKEEEKTKRLSKEKERFTYMMVHELRAPLVSLKDASKILQTQKNKTERDKLLTIINEQAQMLLDEIGELLDAAKLESGKLTIQKVSSDMRKLVEDRIAIYKPMAQEKDIKFNTAYDENLPLVDLDPIRITQVFNNLISNSLKFTPKGGKISISVSKKAIQEGNKPMLLVSVTDTGIGIAKDKQDALFSQFVQVASDNNKDSRSSGSGLGLYVVKGIIQAHGGKIWIESDENQGTTITFSLPLS